jgi:organic radical activating enzyme
MAFGRNPEEVKGLKYNPDVKKLLDDGILDKVDKFENLPVISSGCDTYASIYPEFKKYSKTMTVDEVVDELLSLTPQGTWKLSNGQDIHLILTGGEPLLGWQKIYPEIFEHARMKDLTNVTIETNGTQALHPDFAHYLSTQNRIKITWSCSPKLSVSGHTWDQAIKPHIVASYNKIPGSLLYLKFVVASLADVEEVDRAVQAYRDEGIECPVYLMPVGGTNSIYELNAKTVAEIAINKGWRYSPRLQVDLFKNEWGT